MCCFCQNGLYVVVILPIPIPFLLDKSSSPNFKCNFWIILKIHLENNQFKIVRKCMQVYEILAVYLFFSLIIFYRSMGDVAKVSDCRQASTAADTLGQFQSAARDSSDQGWNCYFFIHLNLLCFHLWRTLRNWKKSGKKKRIILKIDKHN